MSSAKQAIMSSSYWTLNKTLHEKLGLHTAFFLSSLSEMESMACDKNGWFYQTIQTVEKITHFSRYEQDKCIEKLESVGILEKDIRGLPAKRYFRINYDVLEKFVMTDKEKKSTTKKPSESKDSKGLNSSKSVEKTQQADSSLTTKDDNNNSTTTNSTNDKEVDKTPSSDNSISYKKVFDYYLTKKNLVNHGKYRKQYVKAMKKAESELSLEFDEFIEIIDLHSELVELSKSEKYTVKRRPFEELFGVKVDKGSGNPLICQEYLQGGKKLELLERYRKKQSKKTKNIQSSNEHIPINF